MLDSHLPSGLNCYAVHERGVVVEQVALAEHTYRLRLRCPAIARQIVPGQFFMVRIPGNDPLLGRPFALYDVFDDAGGQRAGIDFVYHTIGKATSLLSSFRGGETLEIWGPLGNGFPALNGGRLVCVGGGIGYTPFLAVAREATGQRTYGSPSRALHSDDSVTLLYGVRSRRVRADLTDFESIPGFDARIATDDGSEGRHGFVTDLLHEMLVLPGERPDAVFCCGPEPMMHATARLCASHDVPCWLSLETPMACGFGACFSCVTKVRIDGEPGWDYRRTCVEGPIFRSSTLALD